MHLLYNLLKRQSSKMSSSEESDNSDIEQFHENDPYMEALFADSEEDDGDDFIGYDQHELHITNAQIRGYMPMPAPVADISLAHDENNGWSTEDDQQFRIPFEGNDGLKAEMNSRAPFDFFSLLFVAQIWDILVQQTNLYYTQQHPNLDDLPPHSRARQWRPVTIDEMKVFIALSIAMGLVQKPDLEKYWSTNEIDETPFFTKYMAKDRYLNILSNLHVSDNTQQVISSTLVLTIHLILNYFDIF